MTLRNFERVSNELIRVKEENQELKKQLKKLDCGKWIKNSRKQIENKLIEDIDNVETLGDTLNYLDSLYLSIDNQLYKIKIHKKQQQEFIKYLEDMLYDEYDIFSVVRVKDVLNKYKEIIGKDINVGSKGENK